ncbi:prepilin peptidase [Selenomonas ruminantium]|uniref:prepilin peptidase n=1 Tax=Selenomonas ruminantium TaxID=971 RepID=UPI00041D3E9F|nr:A24 family peptidase [Selenomonas ruminantium]
MISKRYGEVPTHFDWAMWLDVQGIWCALMLPIILWAWSLSLGEFCSLLVMASVLVLIAIYDILYGLIYDQLVLSLLLLSVMPLFLGHLEPADACIGALLGSGLLGGLRYLSHGGLGLGDVKLAVPLGAWLGWEDLLLCLLLAAVMGLIYGGWLYLRHRLQRQTPLPFGPFLAWGALAAFGWGNPIRACVEAGLCW